VFTRISMRANGSKARHSGADDAQQAREAVERSWSVAAIEEDRRRRALAAADRAWEGLTRSDAPAGRRLTATELALVEPVLLAYERAALDRLPTDGARVDGARAVGAHEELRHAAQTTLRLARVLGVPEHEPSAATHALRVAAMAVVAEDADTLARWRDALGPALTLETPPSLSWDAMLRRAVTRVWLDLLGRGSADVVEEAFEVLGSLRELRQAREPEYLSGLTSAEAQHARLELARQYALANAAATLVVNARRGPLVETPARLAEAFRELRGLSVGDGAVDRMLPWLHGASTIVAARGGVQIPLPGLLA
jgi:hypothetical protein